MQTDPHRYHHTGEPPLIAGAGPVGLAAALFLAREGIAVRIVEPKLEVSKESKALAVNPRTLEILESSGLTERMVAMGRKIHAASLWRGTRRVARIDFSDLPAKHPFMLALSQAATERALQEAFVENGGTVERGSRLVDCRNEDDAVVATVETPHGREVCRAPWMLAADGAHSTARERLGIEFAGSSMRGKWDLTDVALDVPLEEDHAHAFFLPHGEFQFLVRVIDPLLEKTVAGPLWRVIGNRPNLLERLVVGRALAPPIWSSSFGIAHRINRTLSAGRVYFAGDAGHIHSPIGARGMNLGIEDAWVFSRLAQSGQLSRYGELRYAIDRGVVRQVAAFSRIVACEPGVFGVVRAVLPLFLRFGLATPRMKAILTGLDHPLDELAQVGVPVEAGPLAMR